MYTSIKICTTIVFNSIKYFSLYIYDWDVMYLKEDFENKLLLYFLNKIFESFVQSIHILL